MAARANFGVGRKWRWRILWCRINQR